MNFKEFYFENYFKPTYSAIVLNRESHLKLLNDPQIKSLINNEMEIIAHHVTIKMGGLKDTEHENRINQIENFYAESVGFLGEKNYPAVVAVRVLPYSDFIGKISDNKTPHVTIAVNRKMGAKPVMSNQIINWMPLKEHIKLSGKVKELP